jgi:hypothetical protein
VGAGVLVPIFLTTTGFRTVMAATFLITTGLGLGAEASGAARAVGKQPNRVSASWGDGGTRRAA